MTWNRWKNPVKALVVLAIVAVCLWAAWPVQKKIHLGLDLQGGARVLLQLNPTALKILQALMEAAPAVVTRQELETRVWGEELPDSDSLRVHIHGLRAVIDKPFPTQLVQTRHGIGYRIAAPDASS